MDPDNGDGQEGDDDSKETDEDPDGNNGADGDSSPATDERGLPPARGAGAGDEFTPSPLATAGR